MTLSNTQIDALQKQEIEAIGIMEQLRNRQIPTDIAKHALVGIAARQMDIIGKDMEFSHLIDHIDTQLDQWNEAEHENSHIVSRYSSGSLLQQFMVDNIEEALETLEF